MTAIGATDLIGLPDQLQAAEAIRLRTDLERLWEHVNGAPVGDLLSDLEKCRRWFDPVAQGQRLRRELAHLSPVPSDWTPLHEPFVLDVGHRKYLVTPEGRCAAQVLAEARIYDKIAVIDTASSLTYERVLGRMYRSWSRHRLNTVISLLQGSEKPLQISAAAVVLALLVNRCTSEERSLTRFASGTARDVVDAAFFAPVQAFHDVLAPGRKGNRANPRLVSGWMLGEARRRLGDALIVIDARGGRNGKVWIRSENFDSVIDTVARDLVRGHRKRATPELFARAFDALVQGLRQELPRLAGYGLVHERPPETDRLREQVIAKLARYSLAGA